MAKTAHTPFATHLIAHEGRALDEAQNVADANDCPCGVWHRGGWYTVFGVPPELIEPDPTLTGWDLWAVVDPMSGENDV